MKKAFELIIVYMAILLSFSVYGAAKINRTEKKVLYEESKTNVQITSALMNGKPAFFKTYGDFINGKGKAWTYLNDELSHANKKISGYDVVFRDENGKKVKISTTDFWGWRGEDGYVYRMGDFSFEGISKIPFRIEHIASDHIYYSPKMVSFYTVEPFQWYSENLGTPIIGTDDYFKNHNEESSERIRKAKRECEKEIPEKKSYGSNVKGYMEHNQEVTDCRLKSADLVCVWSATSMNNMRTAEFGNYSFKKK
jgi:hypothetical protein